MNADGQPGGPPAAVRVAVAGGGVSGLAAANRLIELSREAEVDLRVCLFEAGPRPGGGVHTERIGDYLVEQGADSFLTNKPAAVELCDRLDLSSRLIGVEPNCRRALVLRRGRPVPVPEGFLLMAPSRIRPILASPIFSPWGKLRMICECLVPRKTAVGDESVAAFVRRRFGREALDRLIQPLVGGIYTADPEKLSLAATLPRFLEMERRHRSLILAARSAARVVPQGVRPEQGARYGLFATLQDGMQELVDALVRRVAAAGEIRVAARVTAIQSAVPETDGFELTTARGSGAPQSELFDAVILALPAWRAAELVEPLDALLAAALREIEYASSVVVTTGHAVSDIAGPLDASGLVVPLVEGRRILAVSFASRKFARRAPEGRVLLRTFLGGALQPELFEQSDDALAQIALDELRATLGVGGKADFVRVARHDRSMPQYHLGHRDRVERIGRFVASHPRLAVAGNALEGVGIPDCIQSGQRAAERVFQNAVPLPAG